MRVQRGLVIFGCALASLFSTISADTVKRVIVKGNKTISPKTIAKMAKIDENKHYTDQDISQLVKTLMASGMFDDVIVSLNKGVLSIKVSERYKIVALEVKNANLFNEDALKDLKEKIGLKEGGYYDKNKIKQLVMIISNQYKESGYPDVVIEDKTEILPGGRAAVVLNVNKNTQYFVSKVKIAGNHKLNRYQILSAMGLNHSTIYARLIGGNYYSDQALKRSLEGLRALYQSYGFLEFKIKDYSVKPLPGYKDGKVLNLTIEEGPRFFVKSLKVNGLSEKALKSSVLADAHKRINSSYRQVFSREWLHSLQLSLLKQLEQTDNTATDFEVAVDFDDKHQATVVLTAKRGLPKRVRRIEFIGNYYTLERVLRREMAFSEEEVLTNTSLMESIRRLSSLGYVKNIRPEVRPVDESGRQVDVIIYLEEAPSATANIDIGLQRDGPQLNLGLNHPNFLGTGQEVKWQFEKTLLDTVVSVGGEMPFILDNGMAMNYRLYYKHRGAYDPTKKKSFSLGRKYNYANTTKEKNFGLDLGFSLALTDYQKIDLSSGISYTRQGVSKGVNYPESYKALLKGFSDFWKANFHANWTRNNVDSTSGVMRGSIYKVSMDYGMPLSREAVNYIKLNTRISHYEPVGFTGLVLNPAMNVGVGRGFFRIKDLWGCPNNTDCNQFARELMPSERFFGGETSPVRGIMTFGEKFEGRAVGGDIITTGSLNLLTPTFMEGMVSFKGFLDGGYIFAQDGFDWRRMSYSAGVQMDVQTPIAPFVLIYAVPLRIDGDGSPGGPDRFKRFQFSIQTSLF